MTGCFLGLELGRVQDQTALAVVQREKRPTGEYRRGRTSDPVTVAHYVVGHLQRFPPGTPYPEVVAGVKEILGRTPLREHMERVVVDATGVGAPVVGLLREGIGDILPVNLTSGDVATWQGAGLHAPKRDVMGALQVLLQGGRLKVPEALGLTPTLVNALLSFGVTDTHDAWREGADDDLVLAVGLACWYAEERHYDAILL